MRQGDNRAGAANYDLGGRVCRAKYPNCATTSHSDNRKDRGATATAANHHGREEQGGILLAEQKVANTGCGWSSGAIADCRSDGGEA